MRNQCDYRGKEVASTSNADYYECLARLQEQEGCRAFDQIHGLCRQDAFIPPGAMRKIIGDKYITVRSNPDSGSKG